MFTTLSFAAMVSIVVASPPTSSVGMALSGGWSREAHLLANMQEGNAGLAALQRPYTRPGGAPENAPNPNSAWQADSMSWDDLDAALEANYALGPSENFAGV